MASHVTPLILTCNEEPNIGRVLERLRWVERIVVVDSHSTDRTVEIVGGFPNAEIFRRPFDDHTSQWNYGLSRIRTDWVLTLDADYILPEDFIEELGGLAPDGVNGYVASFDYLVLGRRLRRSLYPRRLVLFRVSKGRFVLDGHTQRAVVEGPIGRLRSRIVHDDRKPLDRWLEAQRRYADLEAEKLRRAGAAELGWADRLRRRKFLMPLLMPAYCLLWKGLLFSGRAGWAYTLQRTYAEVLTSLKLLERGPRYDASE